MIRLFVSVFTVTALAYLVSRIWTASSPRRARVGGGDVRELRHRLRGHSPEMCEIPPPAGPGWRYNIIQQGGGPMSHTGT